MKKEKDIKSLKPNKQKTYTKLSVSKEVIKKRRGGGTLIESPVSFSDEGKYVYVNSGWGIRIFSIKTGECVKLLEVDTKFGRVAAIFCCDGRLFSVTSNFYLLEWDQKSTQLVKTSKLKLSKVTGKSVIDGYLIPSRSKREKEFCLVLKCANKKDAVIQFFSLDTARHLKHHLNATLIQCGNRHGLSFGGSLTRKIMATICEKGLSVFALDVTDNIQNIKAGKDKEWVCVTCHPSEEWIAAGDTIGRVVFYKNPIDQPQIKSVFHWHTLPCQVIAFTPAGCTMYTGGGEHVLVKWNTDNPNVRSYLPRLSSPLVHITISKDNTLVAVSTLDNGIVLVDSNNKLRVVLQQLAWGFLPHPSCQLFPSGLAYNHRTRSVVLNSRPGHLQFFQPDTESFLFSIDVCQQNYVTQERSKVIVNTEVMKCSFSADSVWLATVEARKDESVALELKLKFWQYLLSKQKFSLNTVIDLPHSGEVVCLRFRPAPLALPGSDESSLDYLLVTTGADKFRLWAPTNIDSIYRKGVRWACERVGCYKDKACGPACFSEDGSILAAAFHHTLTIWSVELFTVKTSLTRYKHVIREVEFGREDCCHLVVCCSDVDVTVWNLLTLTVHWSVQVAPSRLAVDPLSNFMALFSHNKNLYIFCPMSSEPVYTAKASEFAADVLSCRFIPRENPNNSAPTWLQKSFLYYLDSNQELMCFESKNEDKAHSIDIVEDNSRNTIFSSLIAKTRRDERQLSVQNDPKKLQFGVLGESAITQLLSAPPHTMPPISLLCSALLESLALSKKTVRERQVEEKCGEDTEEEMSASRSSSSSGDEEEGERRGAAVISEDLDLGFSRTQPTPLKQKQSSFFLDADGDDDLANFSFK